MSIVKLESGEDYRLSNRATILQPRGSQSANIATGPDTSTPDSPRTNDDIAYCACSGV